MKLGCIVLAMGRTGKTGRQAEVILCEGVLKPLSPGAMDPLTPESLLIRHNPVDDDQWIEDRGPSTSTVSLERFQTLEHVVRDSPLTVDPYLELSRIYLGSSRWTDAKRILDLAFERFPENEDVAYLREEAQINRSLQLLANAKAEHTTEPTQLTQERLARCHVDLNVLRERVCKQRLLRHPEQLQLNLPLATALENLGKKDEAIARLREVVREPRLRASAAYQLGQTLERAGQIPEALSAYRRAALFRVPPATNEMRWKSLSAAADLARRFGMVDSERRYVEMLCAMRPTDADLAQRLDQLRDTPLH